MDLMLKTMSGDSTGYKLVYKWGENLDTLYGVFGLTQEYFPLQRKLQKYDSLTLAFISKRDSTFNRKYVPSTDKKHSSYINWNKFNDSAKHYLDKGNSVRELIDRRTTRHEKQVKGYVFDVQVCLLHEATKDTLIVRKIYNWLSADFPMENFKKYIIVVE